ncbi:phosphatase PAP2 family protein [Streptomyces sp. CA-252508]|uniref:phosphatase PAP2 family protein n=1 Tax=Streptomyces sp. CA-252508 TaxID=3418946 RepID=UPI003D910C58
MHLGDVNRSPSRFTRGATGNKTPMTTGNGGSAGRIGPLALLPVLGLLMVGAGLLVTGPAADHPPLTAEDAVSRWFAARRGGTATGVSEWLTFVASTESVIGVTVVCVVALVVLPRAPRWPEALFLVGSVAAQSALFLLVTVCVERPRPDVPRLEPAPPTSSFPSGHVGASLALYGGLATLAVTRLRGPWRYVAAGLLLMVPPAVAVSRLYGGMHHPSDVVGGLVNGAGVLLVMARALLSPPLRRPERAPGAAPDRSWAGVRAWAPDRVPGGPSAGARTDVRAVRRGPRREPGGDDVRVAVGRRAAKTAGGGGSTGGGAGPDGAGREP